MPSTPPDIGQPTREARTGREDRGQRGNKWRKVRKLGSRHFMPCVSLDPAAAGKGGRGGQRQCGVDLRGGVHLAAQRPIAGQQFFRTSVKLKASSHSDLPCGLGGSVSGVRGIRFRGGSGT